MSNRDNLIDWMRKSFAEGGEGIAPLRAKPLPKSTIVKPKLKKPKLKKPKIVRPAKIKKSLRESLHDWLAKAKPESAPSLKPPKKWFEGMTKKVKKKGKKAKNPEAIAAHIWYHQMSPAKRAEKRAAEGKRYGKAPKE